MSEIFMARDSVIFLLQHLGFVINLKKCVLGPSQEIEFLWLIVNSQTMTLPLPAENIGKLEDQCLRLYKAWEVSLLDLTKLIGALSSTIQAVLPVRLQFCFLQQQEIVSLKQTKSYLTLVNLTPMAKNELLWWFHNLEFDSAMANCLHNYRHRSSFRQMHPKKAGSCMLRNQNRGSVVQEGAGSTYQPAGTFSHKVCHFDICQNVENVSHTYSGRQHDSLELFAANRRDKVSHKKIWEFTLGQKITITSEPLPGNLNYKSEWESWHQEISSEWKLCPLIFSKICQILRKKPEIDLFASRLSNQLPSCYYWKPDPNSFGQCSSTEMVSQ